MKCVILVYFRMELRFIVGENPNSLPSVCWTTSSKLVVTWLGLRTHQKFCSYLNLHSRHRPSEVELLFQLLRVFTIRHVPDFHFLRTFLDEKVAKVSLILDHLDHNASKEMMNPFPGWIHQCLGFIMIRFISITYPDLDHPNRTHP